MNPAIITRFARGDQSRICARMGKQLSTVCEYPEGLDQKERHAFAAMVFAQRFDCFGVYVGAIIAGGLAWSCLPEASAGSFVADMRSAPPTHERRKWFVWNPARGYNSTVFPC